MHVDIDPHRGIPAYRQLVDQIRLQIAGGQLTPGAELPSTRAMALRLGINPMTVSKAYGLLEAEGLVQHRPGLPLTVSARSADALADDRERHLREALQPVARVAVQLGIPTQRVSALLHDVMTDVRRQVDGPRSSLPSRNDSND